MPPASIGTLWRTVRHLKAVQVWGRLRLLLPRPAPVLCPAPPLRMASGAWVQPAAREPSLVGPSRVRFLNEERELSECGWDNPRIDRLWRYNLHYFDDLNARGFGERREWHEHLINRWIASNEPGLGTGWEPYPISLRIVNWIKWFLGGTVPRTDWLESLAAQSRWLRRNLEWHLLGNHLFANAKALMFAGSFFDSEEAAGWLRCGWRILERELPEQILADGGHFERSPMYHALVLEDLLDLLNLVRARLGAEPGTGSLEPALQQLAARMLYWLRCMSHPDGGIALFNDAAEGVAPANAELESYAARLGITASEPPLEGVTVLDPSGYVRVRRGPMVALLDAAPLGPDYLPGHGHADTLSFELSLSDQRIIVNGGTSCYGTSAQRLRERGTAWHSTVELAGRDSSEVWSSFRVGRRARPGPIRVDGWKIQGSHDGYRFLRGAPRHYRTWDFGERELVVDDIVEPALHPGLARFHLAPGLRLLRAETAQHWRVVRESIELAQVVVEIGAGRLDFSQYAPQFGLLFPVQTLVVTLINGRARVRWRWG